MSRQEFSLPPFHAVPVPRSLVRAWAAGNLDWGHRYLDPSTFWDQGATGQEAVVFIIDTGIDSNHPDLEGQIIYAQDFTPEDAPGTDPNGHGTWCASRVAALSTGGVTGIAPGAVLVDFRVLGATGSGTMAAVSKAVRMTADLELPAPYNTWRRIASMSLGSPGDYAPLREALEYATDKGVIMVAAAGNSGNSTDRNTINYPARYEELAISVGALDHNENVAGYSSAGDQLDVMGPGSNLVGAWKDGGYAYLSGTSMACPHIAGALALMVSYFGNDAFMTQAAAETYLEKYAKDLLAPGWDVKTGHGSVILSRYKEQDPTPEPDPDPDPEEPATGVWAWFLGVLAAVWNWIKNIFSLQTNTNMENEKKEVKLTAQADEGLYGRAEIVDTLTDGVRLEMDVRDKIKSGMTIPKAFELALSAYPKVDEAIKDWPQFERELVDLFPAESDAVAADIENNISPEHARLSRVLRVVRFAGRGHVNTALVLEAVQEQRDLGAAIFARE